MDNYTEINKKNSPYRRIGKLNLSVIIALGIYLMFINNLVGQNSKSPSPFELKKLTVEELMEIEVTSVSKSPEKLTEVASAIQVLTGEDIRRSTATRLPEALRLASNLQVAQSTSHDWAITARGFNGAPLTNINLSDKLLVMIDGRSIYEPLLGGVFWDVQNVLLEDIDRIEVVSGPGGTLWGANAVNGVINVISKSANETQGLFLSAAGGDFLKDQFGIRYGSHIDSSFFFRVYGQRIDQGSTNFFNGSDSKDSWKMNQGGFRCDYLKSSNNTFTLQGDYYDNVTNDTLTNFIEGMNVIGRWKHTLSESSNLSLQVYFDRTNRSSPSSKFNDEINTYDFDFQHSFIVGQRHHILWGAGYRLINDKTTITPALSFNPPNKTLQLFNSFIQDQISLIPDKLTLSLGTKLSHNDYTEFEIQPTIRLAWNLYLDNTLWAAVSRSVRNPGRFEVEEITPVITTPGGKFDSEKVLSYELGYRIKPSEKISFSLAAYYNFYKDLRSIDFNPNPPTAVIFANHQRAEAWGFEFSGNFILSEKWRLRGGYTYLNKKFTATAPTVIPNSDLVEGLDPQHQVLLQSILDLPGNFQLDLTGRYVDLLPKYNNNPLVISYITFNLRIAWEYRNFSLSICGQQLVEDQHLEFGKQEIPRSYYGKVIYRF